MSMLRRAPRWLRIVLPAVLIVVWLAGASVGGPYFGKVDEVSSNDRTAYLPDSAEATEVQQRIEDFSDDDAVPAVVVFSLEDSGDAGGDAGGAGASRGSAGLSDDDLQAIGTALEDAADLDAVTGEVSPAIPSEDGQAAQAFVPLDSEADTGDAVAELGEILRADVPDGVIVHVTGPAGFSADLGAAFAGIDGLLLGVALGAVLIILIIVYRSLLLPFAVLGTSMFALCVALLTVWWLAKAEVFLLSGQTQGILFILVIGAATDYALLYTARYREALTTTRSAWEASGTALRGSVEPILASGSTVIAGLLCLLFSDLKSNSTLGPIAAIGIVFAMLSALTFLPAVLVLPGRSAFWPRRPAFVDAGQGRGEAEPEATGASAASGAESAPDAAAKATGPWAAVGRVVRRAPRAVWIGTTVVLLLGAAGVTQLDANGVAQSELVLADSEARDGQEILGEHFPDGAGSPVYVLADEELLAPTARALAGTDDVDSVTVTAVDAPSGTLPMDADGQISEDQAGPPAAEGGPPAGDSPEPTVSDGQVLLQGTLSVAADSDAASDVVGELRAELHELDGEALVGGVSATALDTNTSAIHDRNLIIPLVLGVILLILMVLLRSVLAPVLLIATTVLSFGTAMGVSALVFNGIFEFPGAEPAVPLFGFVFLVALGIDYNIFLMTRVREETKTHGTRDGVIRGLTITGGVITSAGIVLAATFAALAVIPILFLAQLAFIVAFGVLLDTFVVRTLLVPALVHDIGPAVWWPSKLMREKPEADAGRGGMDGAEVSAGRGGTGKSAAGSGSGRTKEPVRLLARR